MKTTTKSRTARRGFTLIELMVVIAILAALAGVAYGPILRQMRKADENTALQNGKQVYTALQSFQQEMGQFPSDMTAERLQKRNPDYDFGPLTGTFSNCYFRQLFYSQMDSEKNFYCRVETESGKRTQVPDEKIANGQALTTGECGFAYVMQGEGRSIGSSTTTLPVLMTPVEDGAAGDRVTFDGASFFGKALVVRIDSSATWINLREEGDVFTTDGLFQEDKKGRSTGERYQILAPEL